MLGKKIGMTQVFNPDGSRVGVTAVELGPCVVVQKRNVEKDGYTAIQIGFEDKTERKVKRPEAGHFSKKGITPKRYLREFRVPQEIADQYEVGQEIKADAFKVGDRVDVVGITKGKGFAGVFKTYGFHGGKATHGVHEVFRHGGSLGQNMTPGHVIKGKKMAGHHSAKRVTLQGLEIIRVFAADNMVFIRGPVPGSRNSLVQIRPALKG
jgi:large subunit ribosomal protein L3